MGFVDDDHVEVILWELFQASFMHESLHRSDDHSVPFTKTGTLRLLNRRPQAGRLEDLIGRLVEELPAVCHDQHSVSAAHALLDDLGEDDRLAGSGRHDDQCFLVAVIPLRKHMTKSLFLVRPQLHH